ncbi:hypothetical protein [Bacillus weihaiensis]|uniref:hypothetical protein n=1 Tax=Bacillus weihaiensis TaxID=1547283 RepID=UPI00235526DF|nr:hypothetical protein [Bacillus weihaiensis]
MDMETVERLLRMLTWLTGSIVGIMTIEKELAERKKKSKKKKKRRSPSKKKRRK